MWLCLNNAFLSVVDKSDVPGCLLVRARRKGDIERIFRAAKVRESDGTDYRYRANIPRHVVAQTIANAITDIDYNNFKDSVPDDRLHDAYSRVWGVMGQLQPGGPYGRSNRNARNQYDFFGSNEDDDFDGGRSTTRFMPQRW